MSQISSRDTTIYNQLTDQKLLNPKFKKQQSLRRCETFETLER